MLNQVLLDAISRIRSEQKKEYFSETTFMGNINQEEFWKHSWDKNWPKDWSKDWYRDGSIWNKNWPRYWDRVDGRR
jgi:hypothetical protein